MSIGNERPRGSAIGARPPDPEGLLPIAASLMRRGRAADALATVERLLEIRPDHPAAHNFRGNLLLSGGRIEEALASYDRALSLRPDYPEAIHNRGVAFGLAGRHSEAEHEFARYLALKPGNAAVLQSLGRCFAMQGRHGDALAAFDRALAAGVPDLALHRARAQSLQTLGRLTEALVSYDAALALGEDAESLGGRGMLHLLLQHDREAIQDFARLLALSPDDAAAWLGQGTALLRLNRLDDAVAALDRALQLGPSSPDALHNRATALAKLNRFDAAARDCEALLKLAPEYPYALGLLLHCRLYACDWRGLDHLTGATEDAVAMDKPAIHPFLQLTISDVPERNLRAARIYAQRLFPETPPLWRGEHYHHDRIRIAYLSADFHRHATAFLMAGVFEKHDRARFETIAISYGPNDGSDMRHRLEHAFDRFVDARTLADHDIAQQLRAMEIDIAVDLKGYTGDARPGILSLRPCPIQAHYLGYPGTLGAETIDYFFADEITVPFGARAGFAEQIVWLPGCYQCNDSRRPDPTEPPSRQSVGLPESAFVFCCFNSSFKISPAIFDIWMRLLHTTAGSVLWLLETNRLAAGNLRREAGSRGIAPDRVIFAPRVGLDDHLARLKLADLALDTFPYGAHTTASDAVRSGLPLLTLRGQSFAARVATSVLTAAGIAELAAESAEEYENRAAELARDSGALAAIRARLHAAPRASSLFDTVRFTRHLESAYATMYDRQQQGLPPAAFRVESLRS